MNGQTVEPSNLDLGKIAAALAAAGSVGAVVGAWLRGIWLRGYKRGRDEYRIEGHSRAIKDLRAERQHDLEQLRAEHDQAIAALRTEFNDKLGELQGQLFTHLNQGGRDHGAG